jgi:hypothetical protein
MFSGAPQPCRVFQREDERRGPLDRVKRQCIGLCQVRDRFDHRCGKRDNDQRDKEPIKDTTYAVDAIALFKNSVDTAAQPADAPFCL